jgi:AcrR family transcriptional regulator
MRSQSERRQATIKNVLDAAKFLFKKRSFDSTSIDDIAARAGVAKGAVYHHFDSKEEIFLRVFEQMTGELADAIPAAARGATDLLDMIGRGTLRYLTLVASDEFRQVLLIDGPAVLGWQKWREIDARYFGKPVRGPFESAIYEKATAREIDALSHLIAGAITEAALVCAASEHRVRAARDLTAAMLKMLAPFFASTP